MCLCSSSALGNGPGSDDRDSGRALLHLTHKALRPLFEPGLDQRDQFEQTDECRLLGAQASHLRLIGLACLTGILSFGVEWRGGWAGAIGRYPPLARKRCA